MGQKEILSGILTDCIQFTPDAHASNIELLN